MNDCPFCGEALDDADATKCGHCGEALYDSGTPQSGSNKTAIIIVVVVVVLALTCLCVPMIAAIAIPNLIEARKSGNETSAIGALKTISTAQVLFREADKDGDEVLDYGDLFELSSSGLIDPVLGSGTKMGYVFAVQASPSDPEFCWIATASPALPGTTGDRYFVTNHEGVIFYSPSGPFTLTDDCSIPVNAVPVGR